MTTEKRDREIGIIEINLKGESSHKKFEENSKAIAMKIHEAADLAHSFGYSETENWLREVALSFEAPLEIKNIILPGSKSNEH